MPDHASQRSRLVAATVNRLRTVQLDLAGDEAAAREEFLAEALEGAIRNVPAPQREEFLRELLDAFPSWDEQVDVAPTDGVGAPRSTIDERELRDASFLVRRLVEVAPSLSDAEREVLGVKLAAAGFIAAPSTHWGEDTAAAARKSLGLPGGAELDPTRVIEALVVLDQCVRVLDQVGWRIWQEIAPKSTIRRTVALQTLLAKFVSGDAQVACSQLEGSSRELHSLVAALILAMKLAAREFARDQSTLLAPTEIMDLAKREGKGRLESWDSAYWRKYQELAQSSTSQTFERKILDAVAKNAEQLMERVGP